MKTSGKTGKTAGRPTRRLTCGFTSAREDREERRAFPPRQHGRGYPVFPSSLGLMGEDGKTAPVVRR